MSPSKKVILGVLAGLAFSIAGDRLADGPIGTTIFLSLGGLTLVLGIIFGKDASLLFRSFVSVVVLYWAYGVCLVGRTTGIGLTMSTFGAALMMFYVLGLAPSLVLLRLWPIRRAAVFLALLFPVAFLLATSTASLEEYMFVRKYRDTGVGTTERWTVSNHWLAYDKENHHLYGSD